MKNEIDKKIEEFTEKFIFQRRMNGSVMAEFLDPNQGAAFAARKWVEFAFHFLLSRQRRELLGRLSPVSEEVKEKWRRDFYKDQQDLGPFICSPSAIQYRLLMAYTQGFDDRQSMLNILQQE